MRTHRVKKTKQSTLQACAAVAMPAAILASTLGAGTPASASEAAFRCDPGFYQVIAGQLAGLDPANESYATIGADHSSYNALGYRLADGYLYGIAGSTLYRVDNTGSRTTVGSLDMRGGSYTGDFDDEGLLNISRGGRDWHKVNVDTLEATPVPEFDGYTAVADITNVHGVFFGVSSDGALYSYDQTTLETQDLGSIAGLPETLKAYGAAWSTAGGNLYVGRNSGEIYQITGYSTGSPRASLVGRAPATSSNDGASCSLAAPAAGLDDVDGPKSESPPRTQDSKDAAQSYEENYDEISETFTPMPAEPEPEPAPEPTDESTYSFNDAGMGTGPACAPGEDVDRLERGSVNTTADVSKPTGLYTTGFSANSLADWTIRSGSWSIETGALQQNNICGYDYTVLLDDFSVEDFRWEASYSGVTDINHGGLIFNHAQTRSRSGAVVVDFSENGNVLRWGEYDGRGYYQPIGSVDVQAPKAGQSVTLSVEVHGHAVIVSLDGAQVATFESTEVGGMVGLISSVSQVSFNQVSLTALPAEAVTSEKSK